MPTAGLLDLVAHGIQDVFLIGNPQITYFKVVYKRHTNFAMECYQIPLNGSPNFGLKITCSIPRYGDLINTLFLDVDLPQLTSTFTRPANADPDAWYSATTAVGNISWINNVGMGLIYKIEIKIGGQIIDTNYGEWMNIWTELSEELGQKQGLDEMLYRYPASDGPAPVINAGPLNVQIPLQFWFCRNIGLALPLIALQYHDVELDFYFNNLDLLYTFGETYYYTVGATGNPGDSTLELIKTSSVGSADIDSSNFGQLINIVNGNSIFIDGNPASVITGQGSTTQPYVVPLAIPLTGSIPSGTLVYISPNGVLANPSTVVMTDCKLFGDYIYLDTEERKEFAQAKHRYLIEQVQYRDSETITAATIAQKFSLKFNLPVKELFWILQLQSIYLTNDLFNYSNTVDAGQVRGNSLKDAQLFYNGIERFVKRSANYYRLTQPYLRHTTVPLSFFYLYSFALKPEEHQPSGISNFSKINAVDINLTLNPGLGDINFRIWALNYNVLRIMNGMGSVAFGN